MKMMHTKHNPQEKVFFLSKSKRLDLRNAYEVKSTILSSIGKDHKSIILNLSGIHFIDSTALSMLDEVDRVLSGMGCSFFLSNVSEEVKELIDLGTCRINLKLSSPDHKKPPMAA